jgi:hypothetical protein
VSRHPEGGGHGLGYEVGVRKRGRSTSHTPSSNLSTGPEATARASRVLHNSLSQPGDDVTLPVPFPACPRLTQALRRPPGAASAAICEKTDPRWSREKPRRER